MKDLIKISIPGLKACLVMVLLFGSYMTLAHLEDYFLIVRALAPPFLLITGSVIIFRLFKSSDIRTIGLASAATAGIFILFHALYGSNPISANVSSIFLDYVGSKFLSQIETGIATFWFLFVALTIYELTQQPQKKRSKLWKSFAMSGALFVCLFFVITLVRMYRSIN
ncbi:MAG: hypothetical protein SFY67_19465 [Candidatus Melainabacteria bacterium]|nr:hypothetical protein [Candidatus Melainabacteria bacterium]